MAANSSILASKIAWREKSSVGYSPQGRKKLDTTEGTYLAEHSAYISEIGFQF